MTKAMTTEILNRKAAILREAANRIEQNPDGYSWGSAQSCNCGFIAQVVANKDAKQLHQVLSEEMVQGRHMAVWSDSLSICRVTGRAVSDVVQDLFDAGFDGSEVEEFEHLSDKEIALEAANRLGIYQNGLHFAQDAHVVAYFRVKAEHYERQAQQLQVQTGRSVVPVPSKKTIETVPVRVQG